MTTFRKRENATTADPRAAFIGESLGDTSALENPAAPEEIRRHADAG
jgi:hypothetical protein